MYQILARFMVILMIWDSFYSIYFILNMLQHMTLAV